MRRSAEGVQWERSKRVPNGPIVSAESSDGW